MAGWGHLLALLLFFGAHRALALDNGLGQKPPMGVRVTVAEAWNSQQQQ